MYSIFYLILTFFVNLAISDNSPNNFYCYGDGILHKGEPCRFFAIVIDAGSTGTRLHLYRFVHNTDPDGIPFLVEQEIFQEVKPGLSSFAEKVQDVSKSLEPLLDRARKEVPHFMWEKTPITLKATAGLRLLPGDMADDILEEVEQAVFNSGFFAAFQDAVSVMSGSDEGIYSWFTLNLLLEKLYYKVEGGRIQKPSAGRSVAAFDLGGGSTQFTFWPENESVFARSPGFERHIDFFGNPIRLFTHSFLGNGLVAARLNILQSETSDKNKERSELTTSCMPVDFRLEGWEYALQHWNINGSQSYSYEKCAESVISFVRSSNIMALKELRGHPIYLFSYFFDRALNSGLVSDNLGGSIELRNFAQAAQTACSRPTEKLQMEGISHWMSWQCLDLTYIYSLLRYGYKFEDDQPIVLAKKVKHMEVSWGQGLAYALANEFDVHEQHIFGAEKTKWNGTVVEQIIRLFYTTSTDVINFFNIFSL